MAKIRACQENRGAGSVDEARFLEEAQDRPFSLTVETREDGERERSGQVLARFAVAHRSSQQQV
jgi:hypothetical protein